MAKLAFMHIMKTAGTSLRYMLAQAYPREQIMPVPLGWGKADDSVYPTAPGYQPTPKQITGDAAGYSLVMGHLDYGHMAMLHGDWRVFTFLRDPVERWLSHVLFLRDRATDAPLHPLVCGRSLLDIARDPAVGVRLNNYQVRQLAAGVPGRVTRQHLPIAISNMHKLDFVGVVEEFERSIAGLEKRYGINLGARLHHNQTERGVREVTDEVRQIVAEANEYDIRLYREALRMWQKDVQF